MCAKAVLAFPFKMSAWHESLVDLLIRFNLLILLLLFSQTVIHALSILMVKRKFSSSQLEGILVYVVLIFLYLCICNFSLPRLRYLESASLLLSHFVSFQ